MSLHASEITESRKQKSFLLHMKGEGGRCGGGSCDCASRCGRTKSRSMNALHNNYPGRSVARPACCLACQGPFQLSAQSGRDLIKKPSSHPPSLSPLHLPSHRLQLIAFFVPIGWKEGGAVVRNSPLTRVLIYWRRAPNKSEEACSYVQKD